MKWLIALLPGGLVLLAAWHLLQLTSCKHVDEFGVSLLSWTWRGDGRRGNERRSACGGRREQ